MLPSTQAWCQDGSGLQPSVSVTQTLTDNGDPGNTAKAADAITRLTAAVAYEGRTGMLQGRANYALSQLLYARHDERNVTQQSLLTNLTAELAPARAFVDINGSISQSARSAFGNQPTADGRGGTNISEVSVLGLSPRVSGKLFGLVDYAANGTYQRSEATGTSQGDSTMRMARFSLGPASPGLLSWNAALSHQRTTFVAGRETESNSATVGAGWQLPAADLSLRANAGREMGDLARRAGGSGAVWSVGGSWVPSPRTSVDATFGHRPLGDTYQVALAYRTPLTVWRLSASRNLSATQSLGTVTLGTNRELYMALFASLEPDPVKREALVDNYLRKNNISPDGEVRTSFLVSTPTFDERIELSTAWRDSRSSLTLAGGKGIIRRADPLAQAADDLAVSQRLRNSHFSLSLTHMLTPNLSSGMGLSSRRSRGDLATQRNDTRSADARLGGTLSPRSSWSLTLRRSINQTGTRSYSESALSGTYRLQF